VTRRQRHEGRHGCICRAPLPGASGFAAPMVDNTCPLPTGHVAGAQARTFIRAALLLLLLLWAGGGRGAGGGAGADKDGSGVSGAWGAAGPCCGVRAGRARPRDGRGRRERRALGRAIGAVTRPPPNGAVGCVLGTRGRQSGQDRDRHVSCTAACEPRVARAQGGAHAGHAPRGPPPPTPRTKRTRLVATSVLIRHAASTLRDGGAQARSDATAHESATLRAHDGMVSCVAFAPGRRGPQQRLATGGFDAAVRVWHTATGARAPARLRVLHVPDGLKPQRSAGGWASCAVVVELLPQAQSREHRRARQGRWRRRWSSRTARQCWPWPLLLRTIAALPRAASTGGALNLSPQALPPVILCSQRTQLRTGDSSPAAPRRAVRVWDVCMGSKLLELEGHASIVTRPARRPPPHHPPLCAALSPSDAHPPPPLQSV